MFANPRSSNRSGGRKKRRIAIILFLLSSRSSTSGGSRFSKPRHSWGAVLVMRPLAAQPGRSQQRVLADALKTEWDPPRVVSLHCRASGLGLGRHESRVIDPDLVLDLLTASDAPEAGGGYLPRLRARGSTRLCLAPVAHLLLQQLAGVPESLEEQDVCVHARLA